MRFMPLQNYGEVEPGCFPMSEWTPEEVAAHIEFQHALNRELTERGELVDAQGLAGDPTTAIVEFRAAPPGPSTPASSTT